MYYFIYLLFYFLHGLYRTLSHSQSEESQVQGGHKSSVGKPGCKVQFLNVTWTFQGLWSDLRWLIEVGCSGLCGLTYHKLNCQQVTATDRKLWCCNDVSGQLRCGSCTAAVPRPCAVLVESAVSNMRWRLLWTAHFLELLFESNSPYSPKWRRHSTGSSVPRTTWPRVVCQSRGRIDARPLLRSLHSLASSETVGHLQSGSADPQGAGHSHSGVSQWPDTDPRTDSDSALIWRSSAGRPRTRTELARRAFSVAAPSVWNSLPADIRLYESVPLFKRHLKTHLSRLI